MRGSGSASWRSGDWLIAGIVSARLLSALTSTASTGNQGMAKRVDRNQPEIVKLWRELGYEVRVTSDLGGGFPDVVLGRWGLTIPCEIKSSARPSKDLTPLERAFFQTWPGLAILVHSPESVMQWHALLNDAVMNSGDTLATLREYRNNVLMQVQKG